MGAGSIAKQKETAEEGVLSVSEYIYLLFLAVFLFTKGVGLYEGQRTYSVLIAVGLLLYILKLLTTRFSVFECAWAAAFMLLSVLVERNSGEKGLFLYFLILTGMKGVSTKRAFRTGTAVLTFSFLLGTLLTVTGLRPEVLLLHYRKGIGNMVRHSLAFPHPNVLHISYMVIAAFWLYMAGVRSRRGTWTAALLVLLGNLYIFLYSFSFTGFLGTTVFVMFYLLLSLRPQPGKAGKVLLQLVFPACALFSVAGPVLIKGRAFDIINSLVNTRYHLSYLYLTQAPHTLFGTRFRFDDYHITLDSSYTLAFVYYGIVPFALLCILFCLTIRDALLGGRRIELAILLGVSVAGITEPFLFNESIRNPAYIFIGAYLYRRSEEVQAKLPAFWQREFRILKAGERTVPPAADAAGFLSARFGCIAGEWKRKKTGYAALFLLTALAVMLVYRFCVKMPEKLYVDRNIVYRSETVREEYLSAEEVRALREKGDFVLQWPGPDSPMVAYEGRTAGIEYWRRDLNAGVRGGMAAAVLAAILILQFNCYNRTGSKEGRAGGRRRTHGGRKK
ncbi:MAG: hypothetical protein LKJ76_00775 [Lachnospiraceae bacterium]|jgi:hypothetical protein|nr:hypothetical protein [Lachnospiraceae bacterium]